MAEEQQKDSTPSAGQGGARSQEGSVREAGRLETLGLVTGVLGITALIFGLVLYLIDPGAAPLFRINLLLGILGIIFYGVTNRAALSRNLAGRSTALAILEGVLVIGIVAGTIGVNYFAAQSEKEWDFTFNSAFTLQEQSVNVARELQRPVKVVAFFRPADSMRRATQELVELYQKYTDELKLEFISPDQATQAVLTEYKMSAQSPRIVLLTEDGRMTKIASPQEEAMTNALVQIADRPQRKVYFLTGHGEGSIEDDKSESGFKRAAQDLVDEGYEVEALSMIDREKVPDDASVVVVAGSKSELFPNEVEALAAWLKRGGRLALLLDAGVELEVDPVLRPFGVAVGDDLVVDPSPTARMLNMGADAIIVQQFEQHPIMAPLIREPRAILFYSARSVSPRLGIARLEVATLLRTGEGGWAEIEYKDSTGEYELGEGDVPGPVPMAVASKKGTATVGGKVSDEARLVVFGDSSFASNRFSVIGGNSDLLINSVNWLAGQEERIVLRPKEGRTSRLPLTQSQQNGIVFFSVNLLPLLIVGIGFSVWAVRRRK